MSRIEPAQGRSVAPLRSRPRRGHQKDRRPSLGRGGGQVGRPASMRGTANLRTSNAPEGDELMTREQRTGPSSHRPALRRKPRPLTEQQLRKRLEALQDEIAAVGAAYRLTPVRSAGACCSYSDTSRRCRIAGRAAVQEPRSGFEKERYPTQSRAVAVFLKRDRPVPLSATPSSPATSRHATSPLQPCPARVRGDPSRLMARAVPRNSN
jgi:hypothetical protein